MFWMWVCLSAGVLIGESLFGPHHWRAAFSAIFFMGVALGWAHLNGYRRED